MHGSHTHMHIYIYIYIYFVHRLSVDSIIPSITPVDILDQFFSESVDFCMLCRNACMIRQMLGAM